MSSDDELRSNAIDLYKGLKERHNSPRDALVVLGSAVAMTVWNWDSECQADGKRCFRCMFDLIGHVVGNVYQTIWDLGAHPTCPRSDPD